MRAAPPPFLRIPPFPRARARSGVTVAPGPFDRAQLAALADEIVSLRVGGTFWERPIELPKSRDLLLAPSSREIATAMAEQVEHAGLTARAVAVAPAAWFAQSAIACVDHRADPWHLAPQVDAIWADADADLAVVAALRGQPLRIFGPGRFAVPGSDTAASHQTFDTDAILEWLGDLLRCEPLADPFTGTGWHPAAAIAQLGQWRALIDANRIPKAIYGIARWKRVTMEALLWNGHEPVAYAGSPAAPTPLAGDTILAWTSRVSHGELDRLGARGVHIGEIEDGMIRSQGLGANCVPPLSVIIDLEGVHFDPSGPSMLERLLSDSDFPSALLARAAALRGRLVAAGLSKYGVAPPVTAHETRPPGARRVLVPGQVEDDRSILTGGGGMTNLTLLERARALEPDAHITYRPHPDVEAGHRKGKLADGDVLALADTIERDGPITDAIEAADALHVITSLAGFEALMRGKAVITHGVPFYAGWGLTTDKGAVPGRRGRVRSIDELVAAVLILYPRYLDPVTRLPCPVEILVERLAAGDAGVSSPLVTLRTWQSTALRFARRLENITQ